MTDGHKHRLVTVRGWDTLSVRLLRWPLFHTRDVDRADASPYPYGPCPKREGPCHGHRECWTLSALGILHRWTGFTLYIPDPEEKSDDAMEQGRRLASEREDLIAQGVDPADLLIPLAPEETGDD